MNEEQVQLEIPTKWNLPTPQGNQSMKRKAISLVNKIQKAKESGNHMRVLGAIDQYLKSYHRACSTDTCSGGDKEAVRTAVYNFTISVALQFNVSEETVNELWFGQNC